MPYYKSTVVARLLNVPYTRLYALIRDRKLDPPPAKDSSGHMVWTGQDVERAARALLIDRRKPSLREAGAA